jgi:hypothetical protein
LDVTRLWAWRVRRTTNHAAAIGRGKSIEPMRPLRRQLDLAVGLGNRIDERLGQQPDDGGFGGADSFGDGFQTHLDFRVEPDR